MAMDTWDPPGQRPSGEGLAKSTGRPEDSGAVHGLESISWDIHGNIDGI